MPKSKKTKGNPEFRVDEIETQEISDENLDDVSGGTICSGCESCDQCGACYNPPDQSGHP